MSIKQLNLITGDECGIIKHVTPASSTRSVYRINETEPITRSNGIIDLTGITNTASSDSHSFKFAALYNNGVVKSWGYSKNGDSEKLWETPLNLKGRPLGIEYSHQSAKLISVDTEGTFVVLNQEDGASVANVVTGKGQSDNTSVSKAPAAKNTKRCEWKTFKVFHSDDLSESNRALLAGCERETALFDLNTSQSIWKGKNLPPDPQTLLQHPVWGSALAQVNDQTFVLGTAYKQVRVYDIRSSRRPVKYSVSDDDDLISHRVTSLCILNNKNSVVVGDAAGYVHTMDLRKLDKSLGRFSGPGGSVRQMVRHEASDTLSCVGLDRMCWVFDLQSQKVLHKVYLKQRLNSVILCDDFMSHCGVKTSTVADESGGTADGDIHEEDQLKELYNTDDDSSDNVEVYSDGDDSVESSEKQGTEEDSSSEASLESEDASSMDDDEEDGESSHEEEEEDDVFASAPPAKKKKTFRR